MRVTFYKFGSNIHGFYVQNEIVDKVENLTKKDLMSIADLRHNVLTKKEYYDVLSTDKNGKPKDTFYLLTHTHQLKVEK